MSPIAYGEENSDFLLPTIRACADIVSYDSTTDINDLMLRILYTNENFDIITQNNPDRKNDGNIHMCRGKFIEEILHKVFRKTPPRPEPKDLTSLGYCYQNGYYYYYGGYTDYYATDVTDISRTITLPDGNLYVIVNNTYTEGATVTDEKSAFTFCRDDLGYYVKEIDMSLDYLSLEDTLNSHTTPSIGDGITKHLPLLVGIIAVIMVFVVIFKYFLS